MKCFSDQSPQKIAVNHEALTPAIVSVAKIPDRNMTHSQSHILRGKKVLVQRVPLKKRQKDGS